MRIVGIIRIGICPYKDSEGGVASLKFRPEGGVVLEVDDIGF